MHTSLQHFLREAPVLLAVVDTTLNCCELSSAWRDLLGVGREATVTLPVANLFDAVDQGRVVARLRATAMDGRAVRGLAATLTTAARPLPVRLWGWQVPASDGSGPWTVLAAYDAVRTGQFVADVGRMASLHQQILDAAGDGIVGVDDLGRATYANSAAASLLGAQIEDIVGHPLHDVLHPNHPDAGQAYEREESPIRRSFKDGETQRVPDDTIYRIDGTPIPVEYSSAPIWHRDRVTGAAVVFRDAAESRRLERVCEVAEEEIIQLKEQLEVEREFLRAQQHGAALGADEVIAESRAFKRTIEQLQAVASTDANVLLYGEAGVGKETLGGVVHIRSQRSERPLVKVHCASNTADAVEAELFGQIRDAASGEFDDRVGRLELARGATLLLDEVGELSEIAQGRLLRMLEDLEPALDSPDVGHSDIRIIATTSRDLEKDIEDGRFLEGLYDRLAVFSIRVPPLRERADDILLLANRFLFSISRELGRDAPQFTQTQIKKLIAQQWPGNMRELHNVIEHAVILSEGDKLRLDLAMPVTAQTRTPERAPIPDEVRTDDQIRQIERANMVAALRHCGGRVSGPDGAAELLGLKASTLTYRMKNFDIQRHEIIGRRASPQVFASTP